MTHDFREERFILAQSSLAPRQDGMAEEHGGGGLLMADGQEAESRQETRREIPSPSANPHLLKAQ